MHIARIMEVKLVVGYLNYFVECSDIADLFYCTVIYVILLRLMIWQKRCEYETRSMQVENN